MDTKKLEVLAAAVEYGSFTRAAENLGYTQSGLTHMMNSLEKDIGFPVLLRGRQGVRLTLDADLQRACEGLATVYLPRGCIVVMETATGEVLASVSMPSFDPQNVAASIAANDTSLLNRPLRAFSAGSVFKVVLAAAAYESGLDWYTHDCTGELELAGQTYRCAQGRAHGEVNLRGALEQSCNTYFIELGQLLGAARILSTAEQFGFGTAVQLAPSLRSAAGGQWRGVPRTGICERHCRFDRGSCSAVGTVRAAHGL